MKKMLLFLVIFSLFHQLEVFSSIQFPYEINIFSLDNGKGLQQSRKILKEALEELGCRVHEKEFGAEVSENESKVDINIFFQDLSPKWFPLADLNWFIPNPEWYDQPLELLNEIDLVLCRNRFVEDVFKPLVKKTYFLSFSSEDFYDEKIKKDYSCCLHLAGGSPYKGTNTIIQAWARRIMPSLYLQVSSYAGQFRYEKSIDWIFSRLPRNQLQNLQNYCGIHLCLSEVEGWGHYLIEAMATGAVVITTDAPPMNEYITDKRCLVPYQSTKPCHLATRYFVDSEAFTNVFLNLLSLSDEELEEIGRLNREKYLEMTNKFKRSLKGLIEKLSR